MEENSSVISPLAAILAVVATFFLSLFLGAAFFILFGYSFVLISGEILLIVVPLGYMLCRRVNVRSYIRLEVKPRNVLWGLVFGAFLFLFDLVVVAALTSVFGVSEVVEETNELFLNMSGSLQGLLSLIVALSLAGVCEEFTFRGFLQNAINSRYSPKVALLVSSIVFAFFHFDPQAVYTLSAFLMGLVLGYIYYRWRSYVVSAVAHATLNLIVLTIILLM
jgi:membrane protease YdiL (CAAX protease family)